MKLRKKTSKEKIFLNLLTQITLVILLVILYFLVWKMRLNIIIQDVNRVWFASGQEIECIINVVFHDSNPYLMRCHFNKGDYI